MYLSVTNFAKIEKVFKECLPAGEDFESLPKTKQKMITDAETAMLETYNGYIRSNENAKLRTREYRKKD